MRLPVARRIVVEEIRVKVRDDSCFHSDTWRTIIFVDTAHIALILSHNDQVILIRKLRTVAGWLERGQQLH